MTASAMARRSPTSRSVEQAAYVLAVALIVAVLYWPGWTFAPTHGLDNSWRMAMSWARDLGLEWGPEVLFTWGPLGFVQHPLAFSMPQILMASVLHVVAIVGAVLAAYYLARTRTQLDPMWSAIAAGAAIAVSVTFVPGSVVAVVMGSFALLASGRWSFLLAVAAGVGVYGHMKLSHALLIAGVAALAAYGGRGVRGFMALVGAAAIAWAGVWFLAGQPLTNLPEWVSGALQVTLGYPVAMSANGPVWHIVLALLIYVLIAGFAWAVGRTLTRRRLVALLLIVAFVLWAGAKASFTRHGTGHQQEVFALGVLMALALLLLDDRGRHALWGVIVLLVTTVSLAVMGANLKAPIERQGSMAGLSRTLYAVESLEYRNDILAAAKRDIRRRYPGLTPELRELIGTRVATVDPYNISALWGATNATWQPLPPLQGYAMYTPELDRISAESIVDEPRLVVRQSKTIDGRHPVWDAPSYQRHLYCDYEIIDSSETWQVLEKAEASRCGPLTVVSEYDVKAGEEVAVPSTPGSITYATIALDWTVPERLISFLAKPLDIIHIQYGPETRRWAHGSEATRLMLNAPVPSAAFWLREEPHDTISVSHDARITFEAAPVLGWVEGATPPDEADETEA